MTDVLAAVIAVATLLNPGQGAAMGLTDSLRVYIGTYTSGESAGIYALDMDLQSGSLSSPKLVAETVNPSFLAIYPGGRHLYAVNEVDELRGRKSGGVSSFEIDPETGDLAFVNQELSGGGAPCYLVVDKSGGHVLVANYTGGSVASLPIQEDGGLGEASSLIQHTGSSVNPERQKGPHAHSINLDVHNRFALAADLGLDRILVHRFDPDTGTLAPNKAADAVLAPGAGPRHLTFGSAGNFVYVVNELDLTVTAFAYDAEDGNLESIQTISTLPSSIEHDHRAGYSTAEIQVHPSGKFLYASNRGHDSITVFAIDPTSGRLTVVEHEATQGRTPRHFGIDPSGQFLLAANQDSDSIVVFSIDPGTGALNPTGTSISVPRPVCIKFYSGKTL